QILFALQYLSDSEIVHNDLHAGNVLVIQGDKLVLKLSDLGIAQELYGQPAVRPQLVQHRIMAPELVAGGYSTTQSDLSQLGVLPSGAPETLALAAAGASPIFSAPHAHHHGQETARQRPAVRKVRSSRGTAAPAWAVGAHPRSGVGRRERRELARDAARRREG